MKIKIKVDFEKTINSLFILFNEKQRQSHKGRKKVEEKNRNEEQGQQIEVKNMTNINSTISAITLNIDGLEESIRKKNIFTVDQKIRLSYMLFAKNLL